MKLTTTTSSCHTRPGLVQRQAEISPSGCYRLEVYGWSLLLCKDVPHYEDHTQRATVMVLVVCNWGQIGVKARTMRWRYGPAIPMNSGFSRGRWDRNRTCNLRLWSTRRAVHCCSRVSTDDEYYGLLPVDLSSCVRLCRRGLLSELLSIEMRVRRQPSTVGAHAQWTCAGSATASAPSCAAGVSGGCCRERMVRRPQCTPAFAPNAALVCPTPRCRAVVASDSAATDAHAPLRTRQ